MKNILNCCAAAALLLAASLLQAVAADSIINDVPAEIDATITLNCSASFLGPKGLLIYSGGNAGNLSGGSATPPGAGTHVPPPCDVTISLNPNLSTSGFAQVMPGSSSLSALAILPAFAAFGTWGAAPCGPNCCLYPPPYDWYNLNGYLKLQNGETYNLLSQFSTSSIFPLADQVNYATDTENPGVISLTLQCPQGGSASGLQGNINASQNDNNNAVQASLPFNSGSGSTPIYILVQSGHNYSLDLSYTTGSDPSSDLITWPAHVDNVPSTSSAKIQKCAVTSATATLIACPGDPNFDIANQCPNTTISGKLNMQNENTVWPATFFMEALNGPGGNYRYATINSTLNPPTFTANNLVPSDFFQQLDPQKYSDQPYSLQGSLTFGTFSDFEFFQTPIYSSVDVRCDHAYNLNNTFNLCPGHVHGNINLVGPVYPGPNGAPSPWLSLQVDSSSFQNNGFDNDYKLLNSSYIGAFEGGNKGGAARVLFSTTTSTADSILSGSYDLRLAGLSYPDTWQANLLNLNFYSPSADPDAYIQENVQITDVTFPSVTINACGDSYQHDLDYCFGEVLLKIFDSDPGDNSYTGVTVTGSGSFTGVGVNYTATFSAAGVVVPAQDANGHAIGVIRLFLPQGQYSFDTAVTTANGSYNQPASSFYVNCGSFSQPTPGGPVFSVDGLPDCTSDSNLIATINVISPKPFDQGDHYTIAYTVGGGPLHQICGNNSTCNNPVTLSIPLTPGLNVISIILTDTQTGVETTVTKDVIYSQNPISINCGNITLQMPVGQTAVTVDYIAQNNVQISGGSILKTIAFNPPNLSSFPVGTTRVICSVTDPCSSNSCAFNVIVEPPPCFVVLNDFLSCDTNGDGGYTYNFTLYSYNSGDPIDFVEVLPLSACLNIPNEIIVPPMPIGGVGGQNPQSLSVKLFIGQDCPQSLCISINPHWVNSDPACLSVERCFNNPALPSISCPPNLTNDCTNDVGAYVNYTLPSASSHCCSPVAVSSYPPPGTFPIGVTPVTVQAVDSCGHTNTCQFSVTVRGHSSGDLPRNLRHDGLKGDIQVADAIAVDAEGYSYIAGWFSGTADFDGIPLTSAGGKDIFVAKFAPDLSYPIWVQQAGGLGDDAAYAIAVDSQGNCYIAGNLGDLSGLSPADFYNDPFHLTGSTQVPAFTTSVDMFLAKYDTDGNLLWVAPAVGKGDDAAEGLALDAADNPYVCGAYQTVAEFDSAVTGLHANPVGGGQIDAYLVKYNPSGDVQWALSSSSSGSYQANARSVAIDRVNNKALLAGVFEGTPAFGGLPALFAGPGYGRGFIAQYDLNLAPSSLGWTWSRQTFSPANLFCSHDIQQIDVDSLGNCYFTAIFNGTASIAADNQTATAPFTATPPPDLYYYDFLLGSFGPAGSPRWLNSLQLGYYGGDQEPRGLAVLRDNGDVFVAGFIDGLNGSADGGQDTVLLHYDSFGTLNTYHQTGGTSASQSNAGRAVAVDAAGCVYMTGSFTDTRLYFFPDFQNVLDAYGNPNSFVVKYCPACTNCDPPQIAISPQTQIVGVGPSSNNPVTFTTVASGALPLSFIWFHGATPLNPDGGAISASCYSIATNANSSTLTLACPLGNDCSTCTNDEYTVTVINACAAPPTHPVGVGYFGVDPVFTVMTTGALPTFDLNLPVALPYTVQYRDDLGPAGQWLNLTNGLSAGTLTRIVDPNPNPTSRFYRLAIPANQ